MWLRLMSAEEEIMESQTGQRKVSKISPIAVASALSILAGVGITGAIDRYHSGVQAANAASSSAPIAV